MLKNGVLLLGDRLDAQETVKQFVSDFTGHFVPSDSADTVSSSASMLLTLLFPTPRSRRSRRALKAATAPNLLAAPTGVSSLEKWEDVAAKEMKRLYWWLWMSHQPQIRQLRNMHLFLCFENSHSKKHYLVIFQRDMISVRRQDD